MAQRNETRRDDRELRSTLDYLEKIGVPELPPLTSPFDPGYDPVTLESHLEQSSHLMASLKISLASWMVARESATRKKIQAASRHGVPTVTGGGPFEVAVVQRQLPAYLDLCAEIGVTRIECGEGFTDMGVEATAVMAMAEQRGLEVEYEMGKKHAGPFTEAGFAESIAQAREWAQAGAVQIVVEGRESARGVGLFDDDGRLNQRYAERAATEFGLEAVKFEAPNKPSQFALLDLLGPQVQLSNVRLEEVLRVEIYRRGLHSDSFSKPGLRPRPAAEAPAAVPES